MTGEAHWFGRSGAVGGLPQNWSMPRRRKIFEYVTLLIVLMGTLIWGHGDLIA